MADITNKEITRSEDRAGMVAAVDFKQLEGRHLVAGVVADWLNENRGQNVKGASKEGQWRAYDQAGQPLQLNPNPSECP
jgi:hypothetical protein